MGIVLVWNVQAYVVERGTLLVEPEVAGAFAHTKTFRVWQVQFVSDTCDICVPNARIPILSCGRSILQV